MRLARRRVFADSFVLVCRLFARYFFSILRVSTVRSSFWVFAM